MSRFKTIGRYLIERYPGRVYLPLSLFLAAALVYAEPVRRGGLFFVGLLLLFFVLLFPFRLLDDLYSIEEDRKKAPARMLCRVGDLRPFWTTLYAGFLANLFLLLLLFGLLRSVGYLVLFGAIHSWYLIVGKVPESSKQFFVPLLKYPGLVSVVSSAPAFSQRIWISQLLVFLAFLVYEVLHDPKYEKEFVWLQGSFLCQHVVFRYLPFIGISIWFGFGIFG